MKDEIPKLADMGTDVYGVVKKLEEMLVTAPLHDVAEIEFKFGPYEMKDKKTVKVAVKLVRCEAGVKE